MRMLGGALKKGAREEQDKDGEFREIRLQEAVSDLDASAQ